MPERTYTSDAGTDETISTKGISFTLDGVTFECDGTFDPNDMMDLATDLQGATTQRADPGALGTAGYLIRAIMGEDCWLAFREHRRARRTTPEVVGQIMRGLIEDLTDLPTARPSPSPGGRQITGGSSPGGSPSPGRRHKAAAKPPGRAVPGDGDITAAPAPKEKTGHDEGPAVHRVISLSKGTVTVKDLAG